RAAHAYIFAWHGCAGEACDQRDPLQLEFYVIDRAALRDKKAKISLRAIRNLAGASGCPWTAPREHVQAVGDARWPTRLLRSLRVRYRLARAWTAFLVRPTLGLAYTNASS